MLPGRFARWVRNRSTAFQMASELALGIKRQILNGYAPMATRSRSRSRSKSSSKSLSQFVVGTAAMGLPAPVRDVASTRWGSRLVLIGGALALASGVLTISWDGSIPHLKVNRDRAQEVQKEITAEVQQFQQQQTQSGKFGSGQSWTGQSNSAQSNSGSSSWPTSAPSSAPPTAPNTGSSSSFSNSVQSAIGSVFKSAPGPNSFQQQTQDAFRQTQEQVENTPLFAPRAKVTR